MKVVANLAEELATLAALNRLGLLGVTRDARDARDSEAVDVVFLRTVVAQPAHVRPVTFRTLHERDFIFFRNHLYQFRSEEKVGLRELGPRFTLKLMWLQEGVMEGDYEWVYKPREQETSRTRFML
ncbi:Anticodon-binding [Trinorchestia longiramus]|nr:Anticodon-binding [Trinorchestia longiramus]